MSSREPTVSSKAQRLLGLLVLALVVGSPTGGWAFHASSYDSLELRCRSTIAKTFTKAITAGQKVIAACHKRRDGSGSTIDCNLLDSANADAKGRFAQAQEKLSGGILKACGTSGIDGTVLTQYLSCPDPCGTSIGLPNPLASYSELSQCMACVAREMAEDLGSVLQGLPTSVPLSTTDRLCHGAIGKVYGKYVSTLMAERTRCQNTEEQLGVVHLDETNCLSADVRRKIAAVATKAAATLAASCDGATRANLDACASSSLVDLEECLESVVQVAGNLGVMYAYELPSTVCPVAVDWFIGGGDSETGEERTTLEVGWTGRAHSGGLPLGIVGAEIGCGPAFVPCGECTIEGVATTGVRGAEALRCSNDVTIRCDNPFAADTECGGAICRYALGAPVPLLAGDVPTCSYNWLLSDITGTVDPDVGVINVSLDLSTHVYLGEGVTNPCPVCLGDTQPFDGMRQGTCEGGANDGGACDVHGFSVAFLSDLSLDCPPAAGSNIGGAGIDVTLDLTTDFSVLGFDNMCSGPGGASACACGVCSGDDSRACRSDDDCEVASAGICVTTPNEQGNGCTDGECTALGGEKGVCLAGPQDSFCDGILDAEGNGILQCSDDDDCVSMAAVCGGDCGSCTVTQDRACFLNPLMAVGVASPDSPALVSTFCVPPTTDSTVNDAVGLPGPARLTVYPASVFRYY